MEKKRQFNIYLPTPLIHRLRLAAVTRETSLSTFVERALSWWLDNRDRVDGPSADAASMLSLLPIVQVSDMGRSIRFYQAIEATIESQSDHLSVLQLGGTTFALQLATVEQIASEQRVVLTMMSHVPLGMLFDDLLRRGIDAEFDSKVDESFGLSILVKDPDGNVLKAMQPPE